MTDDREDEGTGWTWELFPSDHEHPDVTLSDEELATIRAKARAAVLTRFAAIRERYQRERPSVEQIIAESGTHPVPLGEVLRLEQREADVPLIVVAKSLNRRGYAHARREPERPAAIPPGRRLPPEALPRPLGQRAFLPECAPLGARLPGLSSPAGRAEPQFAGDGLPRARRGGGVAMESWRLVWRAGFVPVISTAGLESLRDALRGDDPRLTQGSTTTPPPLMCVRDWPVEAACCIGFCGWIGDGLTTVGEVEEFFARACFQADQRLGEPAGCRWFLNWADDTPRDEYRRELLAEVELALAERTPAA